MSIVLCDGQIRRLRVLIGLAAIARGLKNIIFSRDSSPRPTTYPQYVVGAGSTSLHRSAEGVAWFWFTGLTRLSRQPGRIAESSKGRTDLAVENQVLDGPDRNHAARDARESGHEVGDVQDAVRYGRRPPLRLTGRRGAIPCAPRDGCRSDQACGQQRQRDASCVSHDILLFCERPSGMNSRAADVCTLFEQLPRQEITSPTRLRTFDEGTAVP
jgi:hypothetical protein